MFYVKRKTRFNRTTVLYHVLPAATVLLALISLSAWVWFNARQALNKDIDNSMQTRVAEINSTISNRMSSYYAILQGGVSLFNSSNTVTQEEWTNYVRTFNIAEDYTGMQGIGYAAQITNEELPSYTARMRQTVLPAFTVTPAGERKIYAPIQYYTSQTNQPHTSLGFDLLSEPSRRAALERAKATGDATITGKIVFVGNSPASGQNGFTMYMPIYRKSAATRPVAEREIQGYAYIPFISTNFFKNIYANESDGLRQFRIYDETVSPDRLLYETAQYNQFENVDQVFRHTETIEHYGRRWVVDFRFSPDIVSPTLRRRPVSSLIASIVLSFILSGFVLALLISRSHSLSAKEENELQSAKDELLSLASHQLRTPATGVKQYIGMLQEGFAGELSDQQQALLEKAHESNERQLAIINELLYVAKIDADGIVLSKRDIRLNTLIDDIIQEQQGNIAEHEHEIKLTVPKRNVHITADEQCVRMAIENLISNAIKYSPEGSTIKVKLKNSKDTVIVTVSDNGVGIAPDEMPMLFNRFSRIPNELSMQSSGSGIGLYLTKKLIELHGGTVTVESEKGSGSTFTITMPKV